MSLRHAGGLVSFFGAIVIGAGAAYVVNGPAVEERAATGVYVTYALEQPRYTGGVAVSAEGLKGTWRGYWGKAWEDCTIEVERVEGKTFYGTLYKDGAVIRFDGYIDPVTRSVSFKETKVVTSRAELGKWSLGINSGTFSADGLSLSGTGTDEFGTYNWSARKGAR